MSTPDTINRAELCEILTRLGLSHEEVRRDVRQVLIEPQHVRVELYVRNSEGRRVNRDGRPEMEERIIRIVGNA